jgi:hypothetical protein
MQLLKANKPQMGFLNHSRAAAVRQARLAALPLFVTRLQKGQHPQGVLFFFGDV